MTPSSAVSSSSSPSSYIGNIDAGYVSSPPTISSDASTPRAAHRAPTAAAGARSRQATAAAVAAGPIHNNISAASTNYTLSTSASTDADHAAATGTSNNAAKLHNVAGQVTAGATKIVGWTFDNMNILETSTSKSGLRPMHVRVSIRVHHVAFLHPGLDNGGRTKLNGGRFGKWKFATKKHKVAPPGLLRFGSKKGDWSNPKYHPHIPSFGGGSSHGMDDSWGISGMSGRNLAAMKLWKDDEIEDITHDTTEIAEIISAEAFRLSRDGIIQHHYALNHASSQPSVTPYSHGSRRLGAKSNRHIFQSNTQDKARYYKELSERPKGYRRLVISSAWNACDMAVPPNSNFSSHNDVSSRADSSSTMLRNSAHNLENRASINSLGAEKDEKDLPKEEKKDETMFDNVEYQYVGPPKTGPEFFHLLRHHGAATFGRHLPELSCIVPNNSIGFEVRKSKSKKKCVAATQPFVVEAPHVIWGDARDKMLSRIAKEGCPLIDSRKFEYVSNERLHEAEYTESLLVTGSTLWVQNSHVDDGDTNSVSSTSSWGSTKSKRILKARYYGGKMVDGMKEGVVMGAKGTTKTHKETWKVAEKGTMHVATRAREVVDGAKELGKGVVAKLPAIPDNRELTTPLTSHFLDEDRKVKITKLNALKNKIRRRKKGNGYESLGDESISTDHSVAKQHTDVESIQKDTAKKAAGALFIKPVHYELLTDDIIDIRIVSFPNRDDVIASFPISVASVMAQQSVGDRVNDPLKPSELTATLVQEPSAPLLRWGVELKVTLRAVEVKPQLSKMMPRPMPVILDEIGMATNEIVKDLQRTEAKLNKNDLPPTEEQDDLRATEVQLIKEENELNDAIVTYGYGLGENDLEVAPLEIRLRQMFYCEREHGAIARKIERKSILCDDERAMIKDASADPSIGMKDYQDTNNLQWLERLCKNLPGMDNAATTDEMASLESVAAAASEKNYAGAVYTSLEKVSMAMATSLDKCFGEFMDNSAKFAVQSRLRQSSTHPTVTNSEASAWCLQVADKLSACANSSNINDVTTDSSIAKIKSIIVDSVRESRMSFEDNGSEEMKLDEDEIALSETRRTGNLSLELDSSQLVEWVAAVASQLVECAEEMDDDQAVLALTEQEEKGTASLAESDPPIEIALAEPHQPRLDEFVRKESCIHGDKISNTASISTLQKALPRSSTRARSKFRSSSEVAQKFHFQQAKLQTSSLVTTLAYLTLLFVTFLTVIGAVVFFLSKYYPSLYYSMY